MSGFEADFAAVEFVFRDTAARDPSDFGFDFAEDGSFFPGLGACVKIEEAGIGADDTRGAHVVGESEGFADALKEAGTHAAEEFV